MLATMGGTPSAVCPEEHGTLEQLAREAGARHAVQQPPPQADRARLGQEGTGRHDVMTLRRYT
jgi:hypothetical protein